MCNETKHETQIYYLWVCVLLICVFLGYTVHKISINEEKSDKISAVSCPDDERTEARLQFLELMANNNSVCIDAMVKAHGSLRATVFQIKMKIEFDEESDGTTNGHE